MIHIWCSRLADQRITWESGNADVSQEKGRWKKDHDSMASQDPVAGQVRHLAQRRLRPKEALRGLRSPGLPPGIVHWRPSRDRWWRRSPCSVRMQYLTSSLFAYTHTANDDLWLTFLSLFFGSCTRAFLMAEAAAGNCSNVAEKSTDGLVWLSLHSLYCGLLCSLAE